MDSLIHYRDRATSSRVLAGLADRTDRSIVFTFAPRTPLLTRHACGRAGCSRAATARRRSNRSTRETIAAHRRASRLWRDWRIGRTHRVSSGFYISQALELVRQMSRLGEHARPDLDAGRHANSCRSPTRRRAELPLGRLFRLSLFQVSVGMAVVLLIGTLNRVMIVELGVPAWLVAVMISLPLVFAPFRALVGFRSDTHARCWAGAACPISGSAPCCSSAAWRSCRSR